MNLWVLVFSFYHKGSSDQIQGSQVIELGDMHTHLVVCKLTWGRGTAAGVRLH